MNRSRRIAALAALALATLALALVALLQLRGTLLRPQPLHGTELQGSQPAADFALAGSTGQMVRLSDFRGKVVVLYFGYTFCPDVCPTTLATVARALRLLGAQATDVQVLMVTVDPERDTPERLARYLSLFDPSFIGLTGPEEEIAAAASAYGIYYEKRATASAATYLVDHTATTIVVDRQGAVRLLFPFGATAEDMAADLHILLDR